MSSENNELILAPDDFEPVVVHFMPENGVQHIQSIEFKCLHCARKFVRTIDDSEFFIVVAPFDSRLENF